MSWIGKFDVRRDRFRMGSKSQAVESLGLHHFEKVGFHQKDVENCFEKYPYDVFPSLGDVADLSSHGYENNVSKISEKEHGTLASTINEEGMDGDWIILAAAQSKYDEIGTAFYDIKRKHLVIAHRGKQGLSCDDVFDEAEELERSKPHEGLNRVKSAYRFTWDMINRFASVSMSVTITGHAVGGWTAQMISFYLKYPELAKRADITPLNSNSLHTQYDDGYCTYEDESLKITYKLGFCKHRTDYQLKINAKNILDKGYHVHTIVFDSPSARTYLDRILEDNTDMYTINIRDSGYNSLDITSYMTYHNFIKSCGKPQMGSIKYFSSLDETSSIFSNHSIHQIVSVLRDQPESIKEVSTKLESITNTTDEIKEGLKSFDFLNDNDELASSNVKFKIQSPDPKVICRITMFNDDEQTLLHKILLIHVLMDSGNELASAYIQKYRKAFSKYLDIFKSFHVADGLVCFNGNKSIEQIEHSDFIRYIRCLCMSSIINSTFIGKKSLSFVVCLQAECHAYLNQLLMLKNLDSYSKLSNEIRNFLSDLNDYSKNHCSVLGIIYHDDDDDDDDDDDNCDKSEVGLTSSICASYIIGILDSLGIVSNIKPIVNKSIGGKTQAIINLPQFVARLVGSSYASNLYEILISLDQMTRDTVMGTFTDESTSFLRAGVSNTRMLSISSEGLNRLHENGTNRLGRLSSTTYVITACVGLVVIEILDKDPSLYFINEIIKSLSEWETGGKKLIVISSNPTHYEKLGIGKTIQIKSSEISINIKHLCKQDKIIILNSFIKVQGKSIGLHTMLSQDTLKKLRPKEILTLLRGDPISMGNILNKPNFYMERMLKLKVLTGINDELKIDLSSENYKSHKFVVSCTGEQRKEILGILGENVDFILSEDSKSQLKDFNSICEFCESGTNIHWFHVEKFDDPCLTFVWRDSVGKTPLGAKFLIEINIPETRLVELTQDVIILADDPSRGKSETMKMLFNTLMVSAVGDWIIFIDLAIHKSVLIDGVTIEYLLCSVEKLTDSEFKMSILNEYLRRKKVQLLFDGFDEIDSEKQRLLLTLLSCFYSGKVWIATRLVAVDLLESEFHTRGIQFETVQDEQFIEFSLRIWEDKLKDLESNEAINYASSDISRLKYLFIDYINIVKKDVESLIPNNVGTKGIQLYLDILATINIHAFLSCANAKGIDKISLENSSEYIRRYKSSRNLFRTYINAKYGIHFAKLQLPSTSSGWINAMLTSSLDELHSKAGFYYIYGKDQQCSSGSSSLIHLRKLAEVIDQPSQLELINVGLFVKEGEKVCPIHRSIAEYFSALFLVDCLQDPVNADHAVEFLKFNYFEKGFDVIRYFLDNELLFRSNIVEIDTKITAAILRREQYKNEVCVELFYDNDESSSDEDKHNIFREKSKNGVPVIDLLGRNILYYVMVYGNHKNGILGFLLDNSDMLDVQDKLNTNCICYIVFILDKLEISRSINLTMRDHLTIISERLISLIEYDEKLTRGYEVTSSDNFQIQVLHEQLKLSCTKHNIRWIDVSEKLRYFVEKTVTRIPWHCLLLLFSGERSQCGIETLTKQHLNLDLFCRFVLETQWFEYTNKLSRISKEIDQIKLPLGEIVLSGRIKELGMEKTLRMPEFVRLLLNPYSEFNLTPTASLDYDIIKDLLNWDSTELISTNTYTRTYSLVPEVVKSLQIPNSEALLNEARKLTNSSDDNINMSLEYDLLATINIYNIIRYANVKGVNEIPYENSSDYLKSFKCRRDLYKMYINAKFGISFAKLQLFSVEEPSGVVDTFSPELYDLHSKAGFYCIFGQDIQNFKDQEAASYISSLNYLSKLADVTDNESQLKLSKIGLFQGQKAKAKLSPIHSSIAEYFCATFITECLQDPVGEEYAVEFLKLNYFDYKFDMIRYFLDSELLFKSRIVKPDNILDSHDTQLQITNESCVELFNEAGKPENMGVEGFAFDEMRKFKSTFRSAQTDLLGRNVLHYLVVYGDHKKGILGFLLNKYKMLDWKDKLNYNCIDYSLFILDKFYRIPRIYVSMDYRQRVSLLNEIKCLAEGSMGIGDNISLLNKKELREEWHEQLKLLSAKSNDPWADKINSLKHFTEITINVVSWKCFLLIFSGETTQRWLEALEDIEDRKEKDYTRYFVEHFISEPSWFEWMNKFASIQEHVMKIKIKFDKRALCGRIDGVSSSEQWLRETLELANSHNHDKETNSLNLDDIQELLNLGKAGLIVLNAYMEVNVNIRKIVKDLCIQELTIYKQILNFLFELRDQYFNSYFGGIQDFHYWIWSSLKEKAKLIEMFKIVKEMNYFTVFCIAYESQPGGTFLLEIYRLCEAQTENVEQQNELRNVFLRLFEIFLCGLHSNSLVSIWDLILKDDEKKYVCSHYFKQMRNTSVRSNLYDIIEVAYDKDKVFRQLLHRGCKGYTKRCDCKFSQSEMVEMFLTGKFHHKYDEYLYIYN